MVNNKYGACRIYRFSYTGENEVSINELATRDPPAPCNKQTAYGTRQCPYGLQCQHVNGGSSEVCSSWYRRAQPGYMYTVVPSAGPAAFECKVKVGMMPWAAYCDVGTKESCEAAAAAPYCDWAEMALVWLDEGLNGGQWASPLGAYAASTRIGSREPTYDKEQMNDVGSLNKQMTNYQVAARKGSPAVPGFTFRWAVKELSSTDPWSTKVNCVKTHRTAAKYSLQECAAYCVTYGNFICTDFFVDANTILPQDVGAYAAKIGQCTVMQGCTDIGAQSSPEPQADMRDLKSYDSPSRPYRSLSRFEDAKRGAVYRRNNPPLVDGMEFVPGGYTYNTGTQVRVGGACYEASRKTSGAVFENNDGRWKIVVEACRTPPPSSVECTSGLLVFAQNTPYPRNCVVRERVTLAGNGVVGGGTPKQEDWVAPPTCTTMTCGMRTCPPGCSNDGTCYCTGGGAQCDKHWNQCEGKRCENNNQCEAGKGLTCQQHVCRAAASTTGSNLAAATIATTGYLYRCFVAKTEVPGSTKYPLQNSGFWTPLQGCPGAGGRCDADEWSEPTARLLPQRIDVLEHVAGSLFVGTKWFTDQGFRDPLSPSWLRSGAHVLFVGKIMDSTDNSGNSGMNGAFGVIDKVAPGVNEKGDPGFLFSVRAAYFNDNAGQLRVSGATDTSNRVSLDWLASVQGVRMVQPASCCFETSTGESYSHKSKEACLATPGNPMWRCPENICVTDPVVEYGGKLCSSNKDCGWDVDQGQSGFLCKQFTAADGTITDNRCQPAWPSEWLDGHKCPLGDDKQSPTAFDYTDNIDYFASVKDAKAACKAACLARGDCAFADLYYKTRCYLKNTRCGDYSKKAVDPNYSVFRRTWSSTPTWKVNNAYAKHSVVRRPDKSTVCVTNGQMETAASSGWTMSNWIELGACPGTGSCQAGTCCAKPMVDGSFTSTLQTTRFGCDFKFGFDYGNAVWTCPQKSCMSSLQIFGWKPSSTKYKIGTSGNSYPATILSLYNHGVEVGKNVVLKCTSGRITNRASTVFDGKKAIAAKSVSPNEVEISETLEEFQDSWIDNAFEWQQFTGACVVDKAASAEAYKECGRNGGICAAPMGADGTTAKQPFMMRFSVDAGLSWSKAILVSRFGIACSTLSLGKMSKSRPVFSAKEDDQSSCTGMVYYGNYYANGIPQTYQDMIKGGVYLSAQTNGNYKCNNDHFQSTAVKDGIEKQCFCQSYLLQQSEPIICQNTPAVFQTTSAKDVALNASTGYIQGGGCTWNQAKGQGDGAYRDKCFNPYLSRSSSVLKVLPFWVGVHAMTMPSLGARCVCSLQGLEGVGCSQNKCTSRESSADCLAGPGRWCEWTEGYGQPSIDYRKWACNQNAWAGCEWTDSSPVMSSTCVPQAISLGPVTSAAKSREVLVAHNKFSSRMVYFPQPVFQVITINNPSGGKYAGSVINFGPQRGDIDGGNKHLTIMLRRTDSDAMADQGWSEGLYYTVLVLCPVQPWDNDASYMGGFNPKLDHFRFGAQMYEVPPLSDTEYDGSRPWLAPFIKYPAGTCAISTLDFKAFSSQSSDACQKECLDEHTKCVTYTYESIYKECKLFGGVPTSSNFDPGRPESQACPSTLRVYTRHVELCGDTDGAGCCQVSHGPAWGITQESACRAAAPAMGPTANPWVCSPTCEAAGTGHRLTCKDATYTSVNAVEKMISGSPEPADVCAEYCCGREIMPILGSSDRDGGVMRSCNYDGNAIANICPVPGQASLWKVSTTSFKAGIFVYTCNGVACADWKQAFKESNDAARSKYGDTKVVSGITVPDIPLSCYRSKMDVPPTIAIPPSPGTDYYWERVPCPHVEYLNGYHPQQVCAEPLNTLQTYGQTMTRPTLSLITCINLCLAAGSACGGIQVKGFGIEPPTMNNMPAGGVQIDYAISECIVLKTGIGFGDVGFSSGTCKKSRSSADTVMSKPSSQGLLATFYYPMAAGVKADQMATMTYGSNPMFSVSVPDAYMLQVKADNGGLGYWSDAIGKTICAGKKDTVECLHSSCDFTRMKCRRSSSCSKCDPRLDAQCVALDANGGCPADYEMCTHFAVGSGPSCSEVSVVDTTGKTTRVDSTVLSNMIYIRFTGQMYAPSSGDYFFLASAEDDEAVLYVAGNKVLHVSGGASVQSPAVNLQKGWQNFRVDYVEQGGKQLMNIQVKRPGMFEFVSMRGMFKPDGSGGVEDQSACVSYGCQQTCVVKNGTPTCSCPAFTIVNGKNCDKIYPAPPQQSNTIDNSDADGFLYAMMDDTQLEDQTSSCSEPNPVSLPAGFGVPLLMGPRLLCDALSVEQDCAQCQTIGKGKYTVGCGSNNMIGAVSGNDFCYVDIPDPDCEKLSNKVTDRLHQNCFSYYQKAAGEEKMHHYRRTFCGQTSTDTEVIAQKYIMTTDVFKEQVMLDNLMRKMAKEHYFGTDALVGLGGGYYTKNVLKTTNYKNLGIQPGDFFYVDRSGVEGLSGYGAHAMKAPCANGGSRRVLSQSSRILAEFDEQPPSKVNSKLIMRKAATTTEADGSVTTKTVDTCANMLPGCQYRQRKTPGTTPAATEGWCEDVDASTGARKKPTCHCPEGYVTPV